MWARYPLATTQIVICELGAEVITYSIVFASLCYGRVTVTISILGLDWNENGRHHLVFLEGDVICLRH